MDAELFKNIKNGLITVGEIEKGKRGLEGLKIHRVAYPDAKAIRAKTGLSQPKFAEKYGISLQTLRQWEGKRRNPVGPSATLLRVIAKHPEAVEDTILEG